MNARRLVQGLSYVGRAAGKRQTYHVFLGGEYFFVLSFSRSKPNAGNFNVVKLGAVEYVRADLQDRRLSPQTMSWRGPRGHATSLVHSPR